MIELIVAMVILAIAITAFLPILGNMHTTGNGVRADARAESDARIASMLLQADLGRMSAPLRSKDEVTELANSMILDLTASGTFSKVYFHDIYYASPTALVFFADVLDGPGAAGSELVSWYLDWGPANVDAASGARAVLPPPAPRDPATAASVAANRTLQRPRICGGNEWCLVREVWSGLSYDASISAAKTQVAYSSATMEVVSRGTGTYPADDTCLPDGVTPARMQRVFCFRYSRPNPLVNYTTGWNSQCTGDWSEPADVATPWNSRWEGVLWDEGGPIQTSHPETWHARSYTSIYSSDRVVEVGFVPPGGSKIQNQESLTREGRAFEIRNHKTVSYRTSILCGRR